MFECRYCGGASMQNQQEHVFSKLHIQQVLHYILKHNINDAADDDDEVIDYEVDQNDDPGIDVNSDEDQERNWQQKPTNMTSQLTEREDNKVADNSSATKLTLNREFANDSLDISNNRINNIEHLMHQQYNFNQMRGELINN